MKVYRTIKEIQDNIKRYQKNFPEGSIAIVPTMGFLHRGHCELIREAKKSSDIVVVTIFVNKLQFNDASDFTNYPTDESGDLKKCEEEGVDMVFSPSAEEIYGNSDPLIRITILELTRNLCGKYRPGHFEGVLAIIIKFFNIINPDKAFFGKKDYQQYLIIKKMTEEFHFPVFITGVPTIREDDGLAMSSRNARLSGKARVQAALIHRALRIVEKSFREGRSDPRELTEIGKDVIESGSLNKVEYFEIVDSVTLQLIDSEKDLVQEENLIAATAVFCDGIRLIDNIEIHSK
jgi:pantoate--beta-alanine ligase